MSSLDESGVARSVREVQERFHSYHEACRRAAIAGNGLPRYGMRFHAAARSKRYLWITMLPLVIACGSASSIWSDAPGTLS